MYLPQDGGFGFLPGYDTVSFTIVAMALAQNAGILERFWEHQMEQAVIRNTIVARHRLAPVIQCCEDVACKTGLMISRAMLQRHFFPRLRKVIAPLKAAVMPSAAQSFPGPESSVGGAPSGPCAALRSAASPMPSGRVTTLAQWCMP
jgi:hypothetical protein